MFKEGAISTSMCLSVHLLPRAPSGDPALGSESVDRCAIDGY